MKRIAYVLIIALTLLSACSARLDGFPSIPAYTGADDEAAVVTGEADAVIWENAAPDDLAITFFVRDGAVAIARAKMAEVYTGMSVRHVPFPKGMTPGAIYCDEVNGSLYVLARDENTPFDSPDNICLITASGDDASWTTQARFGGNLQQYGFTSAGKPVYIPDLPYESNLRGLSFRSNIPLNTIVFRGELRGIEIFLGTQYEENRIIQRKLLLSGKNAYYETTLAPDGIFAVGSENNKLRVYEYRVNRGHERIVQKLVTNR